MKRYLIVGDVHGCFEELRELCDVAALGESDVLISVGDLVDRGPEPVETVRFFRERPGSVVLMGNHERKHVRGVLSYAQEITREQFRAQGGDAAYHEAVQWMRGLPYFFENEHVRVVHAAMVPGTPLSAQREDVLAGTTSGSRALAELMGPSERHWHQLYEDPKPVVFGHHVVGPEALVREGKVYGLDTGACHGMRLTALSVPDFRTYSVASRGDHWRKVKRSWAAPVLRARPFASHDWATLDEQLTKLASTTETAELLASIAGWTAAVKALIPAIVVHVPTLVERMRAEHGAGASAAFAAHPAKPLLFVCAKGRFGHADVEVRCPTPEATLELARKVGLDVSHLHPLPWAAVQGASGKR
jgi:serine/threonine protein phosphatase 1